MILDYGKPVLAATSQDGRLVISSKRDEGFAARILAISFGFPDAIYIQDHKDSQCGFGYCTIVSADNRVIAMVWQRRGLTNACRKADVVLSLAEASYPCSTASKLIDRPLILDSSGMLIYGTPEINTYRIQSVNIAE